MCVYIYIYIYVYIYIYTYYTHNTNNDSHTNTEGHRQQHQSKNQTKITNNHCNYTKTAHTRPEAYPHPPIPAARLLFAFRCFAQCFLPHAGKSRSRGAGITFCAPDRSSTAAPSGRTTCPRTSRRAIDISLFES